MAEILLVDDHAVVRTGLKMVLEQAGHKIIAEAENGLEAIEVARRYDFDIIIMDFSMPKCNGIEASAKIREFKPDSKILMLTMYDQAEYLRKAIETNVNGFILKSSKQQELLGAIESICKNGNAFDTGVMSKMINGKSSKPIASLSIVERKALSYMAQSEPVASIATRLGVLEEEVHEMIAISCKKLDAADVDRAVVIAKKLKLI